MTGVDPFDFTCAHPRTGCEHYPAVDRAAANARRILAADPAVTSVTTDDGRTFDRGDR